MWSRAGMILAIGCSLEVKILLTPTVTSPVGTEIPPAHIQFIQECRLYHETDRQTSSFMPEWLPTSPWTSKPTMTCSGDR